MGPLHVGNDLLSCEELISIIMEWNVYNHIVAQDKGIGFIGSMLIAQKTRPDMSCS
jgi:hypothetical protein